MSSSKTVVCLLCGANLVWPGPKYENHLVQEHGVVFNVKELASKTSMKMVEVGTQTEAISMNNKEENEDTEEADILSNDNDIKISDVCHYTPPTEIQCYFYSECGRSFKKGDHLLLHLQVVHKDDDKLDMARKKAKEEIVLTDKGYHSYECSICSQEFSRRPGLLGHVYRVHQLSWKDYLEKYGCHQNTRDDFKCGECGAMFQHANKLRHLSLVHGISWKQYLSRVRGEEEGKLPEVLRIQCQICNARVKRLDPHLKIIHRLSKEDYNAKILKKNSDMPEIEMFKCRICSRTVKHAEPHLKNNHSMNLTQYNDTAEVTSEEHNHVTEKEEEKSKMIVSSKTNVDTEILKPVERLSMQIEATKGLSKPPKSDLKDVNNSFCRVCQTDFNTRKSFLHHCQVNHNVQFKTKSGKQVPLLDQPSKANDEPCSFIKKTLKCGNCFESLDSLKNKKQHSCSSTP